MSPDLEPQGTENVEPTPLPVTPLPVTPLPVTPLPVTPLPSQSSWIPTRRWLMENAGLPWSVEERQFPDGPSLFFMNDDGFVRVREYPSDWRDLPEATLAALLQNPRGHVKPA